MSAGFETAPDFLFTQAELLRSGHAWIGVSAQKDGIENSDADRAARIRPLKEKDPERYAPLMHPGDEFSYDIFSQAGGVTRSDASHAPLAGYDVDLVIADGEHQSANRMANYINIVQPITNAFDGFMVHSRWVEDPSTPPPTAPSIEVDDTGTIVRDLDGNALGGIRTPQLDVPVATLSGMGGSGPGFCMIAGTTTPFDSEKLNSLYGSRDAYLEKFEASMNDTISHGFLLVADSPTMLEEGSANWPA